MGIKTFLPLVVQFGKSKNGITLRTKHVAKPIL